MIFPLQKPPGAFISALVLSIAIFGITFGLYFFLGGVAEEDIRNTLFEQQEKSQTENTRELSDHIASDLERVILHLELLAKDDRLQDGQELGSIEATALLRQTAEDIGKISAIDTVDILDNKSIVVNGYKGEHREFIGTDRSQMPFVAAVRERLEPYVSGEHVSATGNEGFSVGVPIVSQVSGEYTGMIMVEIPSAEFFERYGNLLDLREQSIISLDRDGKYLTANVQEFVGKDFFGDEVQQFTGGDQAIYSMYESAIKFGKPSEALFELGIGGKRFGTAQPVMLGDEQVMTVVLSVPTASIYSQIEDTLFVQKIQTLFLLTVAASAVSILIVFLLRRNFELDKKVSERTSELEEKNRQLEDSDRMQKEFINIAAHELRTPVQPLLGIAELLEGRLEDGRDRIGIAKPEIEMLARNAKRLERLSYDILEVSRIESNSLTLHLDRINLNDKIRSVLADSESFIPDGKKILLVFESSEEEPVFVEADRTRLFGVLSNLISNAIKFIQSEGTITVSLKKSPDDKFAIVSVRDTGTGISSEIIPRLFTKFATKSEQGTGLGLYICKNVVEAHGGKIWAESNDSSSSVVVGGDGKKEVRGATFAFTLPVSQESKAALVEQNADVS